MIKITLHQTFPAFERSYSETVKEVSNLSSLVRRLYNDHLLTSGSKARAMDELMHGNDGTVEARFYNYLKGYGITSERMYDPPVTITLEPIEDEVIA